MPLTPSVTASSPRSIRPPAPDAPALPEASASGVTIRQHINTNAPVIRAFCAAGEHPPVRNPARLAAITARNRIPLTLDLSALAPDRVPATSPGDASPPAPPMSARVAHALARSLPTNATLAVRQLDHHLRLTQSYIEQRCQPDATVLRGDLTAIPHVIEVENARRPGLNLTLCESVASVVAQICHSTAPSHRRFIFHDAKISHHHVYADVLMSEGQPPSIIAIESAEFRHLNTYQLYDLFARQVRQTLADVRISVVEANVQRSPSDCLIFCLSFALKSHRHVEHFLRLHRDEPLGDTTANADDPDFYKAFLNGVRPCTTLPADFIKHSHSRELIRTRLGRVEADRDDERAMLNAKLSGIERRSTEVGELRYLCSVEYKRRSLLARALEVIMGEDKPSGRL